MQIVCHCATYHTSSTSAAINTFVIPFYNYPKWKTRSIPFDERSITDYYTRRINVWIACWPWPSPLDCRIHIIQRWFRFENIKSSNRRKNRYHSKMEFVCVWMCGARFFFILSFSFCCFSPSLTINLLLLAGQFAAFRRFIAHKEENPLNTFALNMNTGARIESNNEFLLQNVATGCKISKTKPETDHM